MQLEKKTVKTVLGILCGSILFAWCLVNYQVFFGLLGTVVSLASPFLLGLALAFVLSVPVGAVERWLFSAPRWHKRRTLARALSLLAVFAAFLLILAGVFSIVIPQVRETFTLVMEGLPSLAARLQNWAGQLSGWFPSLEDDLARLLAQPLDLESLTNTLAGFFKSGTVGNILGSTVSIASSVLGGLVNFFVGCVFALYVLMQKEKLAAQVKKLLYAWCSEKVADTVLYVGSLSSRIFSNFISGQCLEAIILGSMFFVSMSLLRFPYAMLVAVVISVSALIPIVGAFIGCFVGAFFMLVQNPLQALSFVLLFLILQQVEGNLIYPKVVGSSVGLPAMWVLVSVTVGGSLLGVLGMLVMVPTASVVYALLRENTYRRLAEKGVPAQKLAVALPEKARRAAAKKEQTAKKPPTAK